MLVASSTIVGNRANADGNDYESGGGIYYNGSGIISLNKTIVAGNFVGTNDIIDELSTANIDATSSYNIIGDAGSSGGLTDGVNGNIVGVNVEDVLDTTLRDNGGPTFTHALVADSVAIDAGDPNIVDPPLFDQRGEGFYRVLENRIDIGAFEWAIPYLTSSIAGYVNGNWWVSSPDANGDYSTDRWAQWPTSNLLKVINGDFNGDGLQDVAAWLPNGQWRVGLANANKTFTFQKWTTWRTTGIKEIHVGDFNNDGKDDIVGLFQNGSMGNWWVARSTGTHFVSSKWGTYGNYHGIENIFVGNFNGAGGTDLAIQATSGTWWVAQSTGNNFATRKWGRWNISNGVDHYQVGDFDGDGKDDVAGLFGTGRSRSWWVALSNGSRFANRHWARWTVSQSLEGVVSGDFNGDGATDIAGLFNHSTWWIGLANTDRFINQHWATWDFAANGLSDIQVGSSNGDFRQDIFARRDDNGKWLALQSTGTAFATKTLAAWSSNANWQHVQVGNFHDPSPSPAPPAVAPGFFAEVSDRASKTELVNTSRWISLKESEAAVGEMSSEQKPVLVLSEKETLESEAYEAFGSSKLLDLLYSV